MKYTSRLTGFITSGTRCSSLGACHTTEPHLIGRRGGLRGAGMLWERLVFLLDIVNRSRLRLGIIALSLWSSITSYPCGITL